MAWPQTSNLNPCDPKHLNQTAALINLFHSHLHMDQASWARPCGFQVPGLSAPSCPTGRVWRGSGAFWRSSGRGCWSRIWYIYNTWCGIFVNLGSVRAIVHWWWLRENVGLLPSNNIVILTFNRKSSDRRRIVLSGMRSKFVNQHL